MTKLIRLPSAPMLKIKTSGAFSRRRSNPRRGCRLLALPGKCFASLQIGQLSEAQETGLGRAERIDFMPALDPKPPCGRAVTHLCLLGDFPLAPTYPRPLPASGENEPRNRDSILGESNASFRWASMVRWSAGMAAREVLC